MRRRLFLALGFCLALAAVAAAQMSKMSPEDRQAILDYQLTLPRANDLISAMAVMTRYLMSRPDAKERMLKAMSMTAAQRRAMMEADPKAIAILKEHNLSASDYLIGVPALRMALMAAQAGGGGGTMVVSPANLAFAKANLAALKPRMDAADGIVRPK
jgi:hypothetical protein